MTKLGLVFICLGLAACASSQKSPDHRNPASDSGIGYICVKGYSDADARANISKCNDLLNSINGLQLGPVTVSGTSCMPNARGVGQGFVTENCAVYDVALQYTYQTSEAACSGVNPSPTPSAPNPASAAGFRCFKAGNGFYYVSRASDRQPVIPYSTQWANMGYDNFDACQGELPRAGLSEDCMKADLGFYHPVVISSGEVIGSKAASAGYDNIQSCRGEEGY